MTAVCLLNVASVNDCNSEARLGHVAGNKLAETRARCIAERWLHYGVRIATFSLLRQQKTKRLARRTPRRIAPVPPPLCFLQFRDDNGDRLQLQVAANHGRPAKITSTTKPYIVILLTGKSG